MFILSAFSTNCQMLSLNVKSLLMIGESNCVYLDFLSLSYFLLLPLSPVQELLSEQGRLIVL